MVKQAMHYATKYPLFGSVQPDGVKVDRTPAEYAAAKVLCEEMLDERHWDKYFLHNVDGTSTEVCKFGLSV